MLSEDGGEGTISSSSRRRESIDDTRFFGAGRRAAGFAVFRSGAVVRGAARFFGTAFLGDVLFFGAALDGLDVFAETFFLVPDTFEPRVGTGAAFLRAAFGAAFRVAGFFAAFRAVFATDRVFGAFFVGAVLVRFTG